MTSLFQKLAMSMSEPDSKNSTIVELGKEGFICFNTTILLCAGLFLCVGPLVAPFLGLLVGLEVGFKVGPAVGLAVALFIACVNYTLCPHTMPWLAVVLVSIFLEGVYFCCTFPSLKPALQ